MMEKSRKAGKRLEGCLGDIKKEMKSMKRKDVEWSRERENVIRKNRNKFREEIRETNKGSVK